MLVLCARAVSIAVSMRTAIDVVGRALAEFSAGRAFVPERIPVGIPEYDAVTLVMPALASRLGALGVKLVSVHPRNPQQYKPVINGLFTLLDPATGEALAVLEASSLTALRTGAVTGLATEQLARRDARSLAVIGTGVQAAEALRAILAVRPLKEVRLFNRTPERAHTFAVAASRLPEAAGVRFTSAPDAAAAARGADIVLTATTSPIPVLSDAAVGPGTHVSAIGAFRPNERELPSELIARADKVVVESRSSALAEAGDLLIPIAEGRFHPDSIHAELGQIFAGERPGRENGEEVTLFKSVGHAVMDVVLARLIYEQAVEQHLGDAVQL